MKYMLRVIMVISMFGIITPVNSVNNHTIKTEVEVLTELGIPMPIIVKSKEVADRYNYDLGLLLAQMYHESRFKTNAISSVKAYGLMQLMYVAQVDVNQRNGVSLNRFDVDDNIELGVLFMKYLIDRFDTVEDALRYYNGGGRFKKMSMTKRYADDILKTTRIYNDALRYNNKINTIHNEFKYSYEKVNEHNIQFIYWLGWTLLVLLLLYNIKYNTPTFETRYLIIFKMKYLWLLTRIAMKHISYKINTKIKILRYRLVFK